MESGQIAQRLGTITVLTREEYYYLLKGIRENGGKIRILMMDYSSTRTASAELTERSLIAYQFIALVKKQIVGDGLVLLPSGVYRIFDAFKEVLKASPRLQSDIIHDLISHPFSIKEILTGCFFREHADYAALRTALRDISELCNGITMTEQQNIENSIASHFPIHRIRFADPNMVIRTKQSVIDNSEKPSASKLKQQSPSILLLISN